MVSGQNGRSQAPRTDPSMTHSKLDPKIALQIADLGTKSRDRQTAHDKEGDRNVSFAQLARSRKCNQRGTIEAHNAASNKLRLEEWNSLGGVDSTTDLDDIAQGQYHRMTTSKKVEEEIRKLSETGKVVTAESVDSNRGRHDPCIGNDPPNRGRSRLQQNTSSNTARSSLDPALEPGKFYTYKNKGRRMKDQVPVARDPYAKRTSQNLGTSQHSPQERGRRADTYRELDRTTSFSKATYGGICKQRTRARGNQVKTSAGFTSGSNSATVSVASADIPAGGHRLTEVAGAKTRTISSSTLPIPKNSKLQQPIASSQAKAGSEEAKKRAASHAGQLAESFDDWMKGAASAELLITTADVEHAKTVDPVSLTTEQQPLMIPREELMQERFEDEDTRRYNTDGRLTPVSFSTGFDNHQGISSSGNQSLFGGVTQALLDMAIPDSELRALDLALSGPDDSAQDSRSISSSTKIRALSTGEESTHSVGTDRPIDAECSTAARADQESDKVGLSVPQDSVSSCHEPLSVLTLKSPNTPHNSFTSRWAQFPTLTSTNESAKALLAKSAIPGIDESTLGDCSNLRRQGRTLISSQLHQSRYATDQPQTRANSQSKYGFKKIAPGPGYHDLVRTLAEKKKTPSETTRVEDVATSLFPSNPSFSRYRESTDLNTTSDDDEL